MKNLVIIGIPRAGKTTLAKSVAQKIESAGHPVSVISADALVGGLTQIRKKNFFYNAIYRPLKHVFPAMSRAYKAGLIRDLHNVATRFLSEQSDVSTVVYEDAYLTPTMAAKMFDRKKFKIIAIGYPNADIDKKIADIRKFDGKTPANRRNDEDLRVFVNSMIDSSRRLEHDAKKHKMPFIDTSHDYQGQIKKFTNNVLKIL